MSVEKTLLRVEADLLEGNTALARQRLTSLLNTFPHDLRVREALARICRLQGDLVQAGRWSYLADERVADEVTTFEQATRDPVKRMKALKWSADPKTASTPVARERLNTVLQEARAQTKNNNLGYATLADQQWQPPSSVGDRLIGMALAAVAFIVVTLIVIGLANGVRTVVSWLF